MARVTFLCFNFITADIVSSGLRYLAGDRFEPFDISKTSRPISLDQRLSIPQIKGGVRLVNQERMFGNF